jgi:hypothetical protein
MDLRPSDLGECRSHGGIVTFSMARTLSDQRKRHTRLSEPPTYRPCGYASFGRSPGNEVLGPAAGLIERSRRCLDRVVPVAVPVVGP